MTGRTSSARRVASALVAACAMLAGCAPAPPAISGGWMACYAGDDLAVLRGAMTHSAFVVAALHCKADALEPAYMRYLAKFGADLTDNRRRVERLATGRRGRADVLFTELVGRAAQRTATDAGFCARAKRAFDWALDPQVTSLDQVPPPYDMGPEIGVYPCPDK